MRLCLIIFLSLFISFESSGQTDNCISIQTGVFHLKFNQTPVLNTQKKEYGDNPQNMFGGYLNDSWGLKYKRRITKKSFLSFTFSKMKTKYYTGKLVKLEKPKLLRGDTKRINIGYSRTIQILKNVDFFYGAGVNYFWGEEYLFIGNYCNIDGCGLTGVNYNRNDIGINLQTGIAYQILSWLTIYSDFNFLSFVYLGTTNGAGGYHSEENTESYLKNNFGLKRFPNRFDLSWQLGIGFNFGK